MKATKRKVTVISYLDAANNAVIMDILANFGMDAEDAGELLNEGVGYLTMPVNGETVYYKPFAGADETVFMYVDEHDPEVATHEDIVQAIEALYGGGDGCDPIEVTITYHYPQYYDADAGTLVNDPTKLTAAVECNPTTRWTEYPERLIAEREPDGSFAPEKGMAAFKEELREYFKGNVDITVINETLEGEQA